MKQIELVDNVEATLLPLNIQVTLCTGQKGYLLEERPEGFIILVNGSTYLVPLPEAHRLGLSACQTNLPTEGLAQSLTTSNSDIKLGPMGEQIQGSEAQHAAELKQVEQKVWDQLKQCFDPEIPINIVDLGLIYDCRVEPSDKPGKFRVTIKMTLTAPGCAMAPYIQQDVYNHMMSIPEIEDALVELVWDPPWNQNMMSEEAKLLLGLL